jgi:hypothetical protein
MDKVHFAQRVKGVREMKRHVAGKPLRGVRVTKLAQPGVRANRESQRTIDRDSNS